MEGKRFVADNIIKANNTAQATNQLHAKSWNIFTCKMLFKLSVLLGVIIYLNYGDTACPGVVTRKEWNALNPLQVKKLRRPVRLVIIQHTATPACTTDAACIKMVQSIQDYHVDSLFYWDIGPNFLVGGNGKIYEGTGWIHEGAHTFGYNNRSLGISFIGNYNNVEPTRAQVKAVDALIKCGISERNVHKDYNLVGHRQLIATESPGRRLYSEIRTWPHFLANVTSIRNP